MVSLLSHENSRITSLLSNVLKWANVTTIVSATTCPAVNGKITVIASGGSGYFNYSKNGGLAYQSSNVFTALAHGTYTVKVKDVLGCLSLPGNAVVGPSCGVREGDFSSNTTMDNSLTVYPNPAKDGATVTFYSTTEEVCVLKMVDVMGRILFSMNAEAIVGENQFQMNLTGISRGIYFIVLERGEGVMQTKMVVE